MCEHCDGQRFDRMRVLKVVRKLRKDIRGKRALESSDQAFALVLAAIRALDIPHVAREEAEIEMVH